MIRTCYPKSQRDMTMVASHFNGWNTMAWNTRAFRYATSNPRLRTYGTHSDNNHITKPAIEMAG